VPTGGSRGDRFQFGVRGHAAGRVVGAAEDQGGRSGGELALDPLEIELHSHQGHFGQFATCVFDHGEERVVDGRVYDDALAGPRSLSGRR
jgi:hypothetical protein